MIKLKRVSVRGIITKKILCKKAEIKTQRASQDVPEPVGSPAVLLSDRVSNLPLPGCPFFVHNTSKGGNIMDKISGKLTIFHDGTFWIGVFEREEGDKLSVCKVTFGAEPREADVFEFVINHYYDLEFSMEIEVKKKRKADNPKRRSREARKQLAGSGIGTKSQQALQLQREQLKTEKKKNSKEQREAEKERRFELKQKKRKEKQKGH